MNLKEIRNKLEQEKGKQAQLETDIVTLAEEIQEQEQYLHNLEKAKEIVKLVSLKTQQELQFHISDITSLALESVFPDPYKLVLDFVERRNKTECDILFERDGSFCNPVDSSGIGSVDIASFALRIASWCMSMPRTRNTIILDEPMKHLSKEYQEAASMMIKQISKKLGIQFIIITHNPIMATFADRTFNVTARKVRKKNWKISKVELL